VETYDIISVDDVGTETLNIENIFNLPDNNVHIRAECTLGGRGGAFCTLDNINITTLIAHDRKPNINFTYPTPSNGSSEFGDSIYVNVSSSDLNSTLLDGQHYVLTDFDRSLFSWFRMDDRNSSGGVIDLSTYSHNGSLIGNTAVNNTAKWGNASWFDGTGDYVDLGSSYTFLDGSRGFTIALWIYPRSLPFSGFQGVFARGSTSKRVPWIYGYDGDTILQAVFETEAGSGDAVLNTGSLTAGVWNHIVLTWNGTTAVFYQQGSFQSSDTTIGNTLANTDGTNHLARISGFADLNGGLDEVVVSLAA
jgi:hypothetical protein